MVLPLVQYCKKCRREVPLSEHCAHCGGRLGRNSETLAFDVIHVPVKDWFCWNSWLRIALPAAVLVAAGVFAAEYAFGGAAAALALLGSSFLPIILALLVAALVVGWVALGLQGGERIHYAMDKLGLHAWTYLENYSPVQLKARLLTPDMLTQLEGDERALLDMTLIRHQFIAWKDVRRTHFWKENGVLLIYRPSWWQVMAVRCPVEELSNVQAMVNAHVKQPAKHGKKPTPKRKKKT